MDLYERFKSAANEIQANYPIIGTRAFVLSNKILSFLSFNSKKIISYSSLSGLNDLGFVGGGFYSDNDKGVIITTLPLFDDNSKVDVRLLATSVRILQILGIEELFLFGLGETLQGDDNGEVMFWADDHINLSDAPAASAAVAVAIQGRA